MIRVLHYFGLFLIAAALWHCSPRTAVSTSPAAYTEDLSAYRPQLPDSALEIAAPSDLPDRGAYVVPRNDMSAELYDALERVVEENRQQQVSVYMIQIYSGRSREEANNVRQLVYSVLPEFKPELAYRAPNFRVLIGRYADRVEANKPLTQLKAHFPGAILVPERIYLEPEEQ